MKPILTSTSARDEAGRFVINFPQREGAEVSQDAEICEVTYDGETRTLRFHDYGEIFSVPGLYETLFYTELECTSPTVVSELLADVLEERGESVDGMRVLDVGAGNGMVGEELRNRGAEVVVGADILPEAAAATERDRPGVYDEYLVADLTDLDAGDLAMLHDQCFNSLVTVAALGFGDMPPEAFRVAYNTVCDGGLVALTINEKFLEPGEHSGFSQFVDDAITDGAMKVLARKRYKHRLSVTGEEIFYVAVVLEKLHDIN